MKRKVQPRIKRERLWGVFQPDGRTALTYGASADFPLAMYASKPEASMAMARMALSSNWFIAEVVLVRAPKRRKGAK